MNNALIVTIIIILLIVVLFALVSLSEKNISKNKRTKILKRLEELQSGCFNEQESIRRDSIIKLDNLLSKTLQYYYNNTLSCGENLKKAVKIFKKNEYNDLWDVHKIRNSIVHDDRGITLDEAKKVYNTYKISILKILK